MRWRSEASTTEKLYGAIVAQARLPVFYRSFGVPDTLQGRFTLLALHLFVVLHRLKSWGPEGGALAQDLVDRFSQDMETVLRELGVSDLRVPRSMRRLAAASKGLFEDYETALAAAKRPSRTLSPRLCQTRRKARSLAAGRSHPIYWLRSTRSTDRTSRLCGLARRILQRQA
jgi:cytochrome b pre-mRNA-processing protein 3